MIANNAFCGAEAQNEFDECESDPRLRSSALKAVRAVKPNSAHNIVKESARIPYASVGHQWERFASHLVSTGSSFQRILPSAQKLSVMVLCSASISSDTEFALSGAIVLGNGRICQGTIDSLLCLEATGEVVWMKGTQGAVDSVVEIGELILSGSRDGRLSAWDIADGTLQWEFKAQSWVSGIAAVDKNAVVFGSRDGKIRYISLDGTLRWECDLGARILAVPCVDGERVFVGARNGLFFALDLATGRILASLETGSDVHGAATIAGSRVLFGSDDKRLYCVDRETLAIQWMYRTGDAVWCKPLVVGDTVVFGSTDTYLYGLDLSTGLAKWEIGTTGPVRLGLAAIKETVCVANERGNIFFVDLTTGKIRGIASVDGSVWAAPAPQGTGFLITHRGNEVMCVTEYPCNT